MTFNSLYEIQRINRKNNTTYKRPFNSLYEIHVFKQTLNTYYFFDFQFSLWDSWNILPLGIWSALTFNSLYEIQLYRLQAWNQRLPLSILFMRFYIFGVPEPEGIFTQLSILFMRFSEQTTTLFEYVIDFQFSLWDSIRPDKGKDVEITDFQFSLWDSYNIKKLMLRQYELSILFMRFIESSNNSNKRIIIFQFSLWDSRPPSYLV